MSIARTYFTATRLQNGKVLIAGGGIGMGARFPGSGVSTVELYDPSTRSFSAAASMAVGRFGHTATLLANGKVLVAGGSPSQGVGAMNRVEIYDPSANAWSSAASMRYPRTGHAAVLIAGGKVFVTGGGALREGSSPRDAAPATIPAEIYDPAADAWSVAAMPALDRPTDPTATVLKDGRVLVVGGQAMWRSSDTASENSEMYDPASNTWSAVPPDARTGARQFQTATMLSSGAVLVAGGSLELNPTAFASLYDPVKNAWTAAANMTTARCGASAQLLQSGKVLVVGSGCDYSTALSATAEEYDAATNRWSPAAGMNQPRGNLITVLLKDGTVLALGGGPMPYTGASTAAAELFIP